VEVADHQKEQRPLGKHEEFRQTPPRSPCASVDPNHPNRRDEQPNRPRESNPNDDRDHFLVHQGSLLHRKSGV
jgi:hypothetical protein